MNSAISALIALLVMGAPVSALSQEAARQPWEEYDKLVKSAETVGTLGPTLFGDQVNFANGALSFSATDVSIPGNNSLPVAFTRSFTVSNRKGFNGNDAALADWDLDTPHLSGVFSSTWPDNRCSVTTIAAARPPTVTAGVTTFRAEDYWQGNQASMPGGGEMLLVSTSAPKPSTGGPYYWMTSSQTYFSCLDTIKNGTGQGFLAITAEGTKYWFDRMAAYYEPSLEGKTSQGGKVLRARSKVALYATRVEDRFGNWVTYTYTNAAHQPAHLTSIQAGDGGTQLSDGRQITLGYNPQGDIEWVSNGTQTWTYEYSYPTLQTGTLTGVVLPDGSRWSIDLALLGLTGIDYDQGQPGDPWRSCDTPGILINDDPVSGTISHPSGAVGEFIVRPKRFGRSNVPKMCSNYTTIPANDPNDDVAYYPLNYDSLALITKRVSGPGVAVAEWNYAYGATISWAPGTGPVCTSGDCGAVVCTTDACAGTTATTITGPNSEWMRYTFGNSYRYNEGKLLKVESGSGPTAILKTETTSYELAQSGQSFPTPIGTSPQPRGDGFTSEYLRPQKANSVLQDGATFSSTVTSFDDFARPLAVTKASTGMVTNFTKTDTNVYHDNPTKWVLGQMQSTATNGIVVAATTFDPATALPLTQSSFGKLQQTLTYNTNGTLATVKDGNNQVTQLSNWKRGIPQTIQYPPTPESPAGAIESAVVNDLGWVLSTTNENGAGYTTTYTHDPMGRLASIAYPTGDSTAWTTTTRSFAPVAAPEYGIPTGHWKQIVQTGTGVTTTFYDAQWRPLLTLTQDTTNAATKSFVVNRYDALGHLVFASYPVASLTTVNDVLLGTTTTYDPLGRVTQVAQNSELGPLITTTEYLSQFRTRVTNPRGYQTTTGYQAFDAPSTEAPVRIESPGSVTTTIARDGFGKPLTVTRTGPGG